MSLSIPLRYFLPETRFAVRVTPSTTVEVRPATVLVAGDLLGVLVPSNATVEAALSRGTQHAADEETRVRRSIADQEEERAVDGESGATEAVRPGYVPLPPGTTIEVEPAGSYVVPRLEVKVTSTVRAARRFRCVTTIKENFLEEIVVSVGLSDDGLIETVNTESSRDLSPIIDLASKVFSLVLLPFSGIAGMLHVTSATPPTGGSATGSEEEAANAGPLEKQWGAKNPELQKVMEAIEARISGLLETISDSATTTKDTIEVGEVLAVLYRELAALDRVRREWIAGHVRTGQPEVWEFTSDELVFGNVRPGREFPATLSADLQYSDAVRQLADRHGVLLVLSGSAADKPVTTPGGERDREDEILFRRPRPSAIAMYRREKDEPGAAWTLQPETIQRLDVVDSWSHVDSLSLKGEFWHKHAFKMDLHPDRSIKTYGLTSKTSLGPLASSVGGLVSAGRAAYDEVSKLPSDEEQELSRAKLKLDLLTASDGYSKLSATHQRNAELAELEQRVKIAELRTKPGARP